MDSAWFAVRATAVYLRYLNIASSPCVKKCQSNSYLTSFWPEAFLKIFLKCYWQNILIKLLKKFALQLYHQDQSVLSIKVFDNIDIDV